MAQGPIELVYKKVQQQGDGLHIVLSFTQPPQPPATLDRLINMDFNGTWQVYSQENYEEFLRAMGEKKIVI